MDFHPYNYNQPQYHRIRKKRPKKSQFSLSKVQKASEEINLIENRVSKHMILVLEGKRKGKNIALIWISLIELATNYTPKHVSNETVYNLYFNA